MNISKYKTEILIISLAILCIASGLLVSIISLDWSWLERSGSLVVIIAISTFWKFGLARRKKLSESLLKYNSAVEEMGTQVRDMNAEPFIALKVNVPNVEQSIKNNEEKYERLTKLEIILGGIGTFIWGYASPIFCYLAPIQACT
ncbi:hypothetical protein ACVBIO_01880 [Shewanella sp. 0m-8]